jgi:dTDP-4-dehydrorhamnose reductase
MIIGGSGYVGSHLTQLLAKTMKCLATYYSHKQISENPNLIWEYLDVRDEANLANLIKTYDPSCILNLAAASPPNWVQNHRKESYAINVTNLKNIRNIVQGRKIPVIHLSTCYVFSGNPPVPSAGYNYTDRPNPINYYGETKLKGEQEILKYKQGSVIRTSQIYGPINDDYKWFKPNLFTKIFYKLIQEKNIDMGTVQRVIKPTYLNDLIAFLMQYIKNPGKGIFHAVGPEKTTKYNFALQICEVWGFNSQLIKLKSRNAYTTNQISKPLDSSLDCSRTEQIYNSIFRNIKEALLDIKKKHVSPNFHDILTPFT